MYTVGTDLVLQAEMHYRTERMQRSWRPSAGGAAAWWRGPPSSVTPSCAPPSRDLRWSPW